MGASDRFIAVCSSSTLLTPWKEYDEATVVFKKWAAFIQFFDAPLGVICPCCWKAFIAGWPGVKGLFLQYNIYSSNLGFMTIDIHGSQICS